MTRVPAWSSCNRVLDERWHESQLQAHRERLEFIQSANSVTAEAFSSALAASAYPHRFHANSTSSNPVKIIPRSKSPAVKSRQAQIGRDNLLLIKKIIALDNKAAAPSIASTKKRASGASKKRHSRTSACVATGNHDRSTIVVPKAAHSSHACLRLPPEVPHSAASHALFTRGSATMKNNFAEQNTPTMLHASNSSSAAARIRSRAQAKILDENKKMLQRILTARTTVSRSTWRQHEEEHNKLLNAISRHPSTPNLQQHQRRMLRDSQSQDSLQRPSSDEFELSACSGGSSFVRVDPTSHLVPKRKCRPHSASQRTARARAVTEASCPVPLHSSRRSGSSESVVTRMRRMTFEHQADEDDAPPF